MISRRDLMLGGLGALPLTRAFPLLGSPSTKPLRLAVITDLHHGLAPDATERLTAFVNAVEQRDDVDLVLQLGDFCHPTVESHEFLDVWHKLEQPKIHVLGNHDMDLGDKAIAMRNWGMKSRYGSEVHNGYRFVTLDLNHFKKEGKLFDYANGNYFTDNATYNWCDPDQLGWLNEELRKSKEPVILLSHQPLGFAEPGQPMPSEQVEVLNVVEAARRDNPRGQVILSMFGHLHVDRLENYQGLPCYCVNSASYFWYEGMRKYTKPLFAFMELSSKGVLNVHGAAGEFVQPPPPASDTVIGRSASIGDRRLNLRTTQRH